MSIIEESPNHYVIIDPSNLDNLDLNLKAFKDDELP